MIANAQQNLWKSIVVHVRYSRNNTGMIEVWHGDATLNQSAPTFSVSGINIGQDCWNGDSLQNGTAIKFGMYCHDDSNYTNGETRVLYWDMPSVLVGNPTDAWKKVNPYQPNY
ncbi:heparin lyase I family protein [Mucilaginibacter terrae]|uniref:heparin lyase I family protein n=1 Tax=Mucilaginibacter terrae TaxID=1955052 RepID=UPI003631D7CF